MVIVQRSSVAKGGEGSSPPLIDMQIMENTTFSALIETGFCTGIENSPPHSHLQFLLKTFLFFLYGLHRNLD